MTDLSVGRWPLIQKILFRFAFTYFTLFIIFENNGAFPLWDWVMKYPTEGLHIFIPWIGKNIIRLSYEITTFTNGSGDTTYDYVIVLCCLVGAMGSAIIWSILDRHRENYQRLYYWLTVAVRFYVGLMLINYGLYKVIKVQFPDPNVYRLTQMYGDSTPMGLAWTFLGFSTGYNLFMGIAEVAAVLLLVRRTMTIGAIITLMTTANVMAVNYFYDVPVKILSTHLVLMTLLLLLHDAKALWKFFAKGDSVRLEVIPLPSFPKRWIRIVGLSFKFLLIGYALFYGAYEVMGYQRQYANFGKGEFDGYYVVKKFTSNSGKPVDKNWKRMSIIFNQYATVTLMNDSTVRFTISKDSLNRKMWLIGSKDTTVRCNFIYTHLDSTKFQFKGTIMKDSASITFDKLKDFQKHFKLTNTGFHWINEFPNNR
ncbi:hypothetical protein WSM22_44740 [Cytophagales bacterium WSM2-2]|nr:hypothetical protein WSM22_44740 [Cytophagales bacterium WSM2-2]